ncbi:MAG: tetratricopeptide repeat protein, partial [Lewinella sp.]|nr:tetratricopeptide repeat protein [Lewinella sp.]
TLSRGIEHALLAIFGMVAHETEHYAAAVEVFEDLQQSTPPEEQDPQIGMLLADSYVRLQQTDRALPILNQLIDQDRDNLDAVTMRGNILFEQGQYDEAVADLDRAIAADPEDGNLRTKRAAANIRTSRLDLAREDLEYVQRSETDQRAINKINTEYQARASIERSRLQDAEQRIERNPRDTSALRIKAEAARNLGDYEISKQAAASLLQVEPSSAFGLATLMEIKPQLQDTHSVNRLIESVRTRITNEELLKAAPRLRTSSQLQNIQIRQ